MICDQCGMKNVSESTFCSGCGSPLGWVCTCAFTNRADALYCGGCGRSLSQVQQLRESSNRRASTEKGMDSSNIPPPTADRHHNLHAKTQVSERLQDDQSRLYPSQLKEIDEPNKESNAGDSRGSRVHPSLSPAEQIRNSVQREENHVHPTANQHTTGPRRNNQVPTINQMGNNFVHNKDVGQNTSFSENELHYKPLPGNVDSSAVPDNTRSFEFPQQQNNFKTEKRNIDYSHGFVEQLTEAQIQRLLEESFALTFGDKEELSQEDINRLFEDQ